MFSDRFMRYARENDASWRGLRFVCVGLFAGLMAAGCLWPVLWSPAVAAVAFLTVYAAWCLVGVYYERRFWPARDRLDTSGDRPRALLWACLGASLAAVAFLGAWAGYAPHAAGLVVAAWLSAYQAVHGKIRGHYRVGSFNLVVLGILMPIFDLLGLESSKTDAVVALMLAWVAFTFGIAGSIEHYNMKLIKRNRFGGEGF